MISIRARRLNSSGTISPLLIPVLPMMMDETCDSVVVFVNVREAVPFLLICLLFLRPEYLQYLRNVVIFIRNRRCSCLLCNYGVCYVVLLLSSGV